MKHHITVCVEGIDGCGKSSVVEQLAKDLDAATFKFHDRSTAVGAAITAHLEETWAVLSTAGDATALDALVFQALHTINRLEVAPRLAAASAGQDVVLDRYWPSGVAFGSVDGLDKDWLIKLHRTLPQPDLFVLIDVDVQDAIERMSSRGAKTRYEREVDRFTQRLVAYRGLWLAMQSEMTWLNYGFPRPVPQWRVIDGRGEFTQTYARVLEAVRAVPRT